MSITKKGNLNKLDKNTHFSHFFDVGIELDKLYRILTLRNVKVSRVGPSAMLRNFPYYTRAATNLKIFADMLTWANLAAILLDTTLHEKEI